MGACLPVSAPKNEASCFKNNLDPLAPVPLLNRLSRERGQMNNHSEPLHASAWSYSDAGVCRFLAKSGAAYGLQGATPDDLDDAGRETLAEVAAPYSFSPRIAAPPRQMLPLAQHERIPW